MRAWLVTTSLAVLLVGLSFSHPVGAQDTTNLYKKNYSGQSTAPVRQQSAPLLGGLFRVRDYFPTVFAYNPKPTYTMSTIPNPDTNAKGYLDAFGFRRVGR